ARVGRAGSTRGDGGSQAGGRGRGGVRLVGDVGSGIRPTKAGGNLRLAVIELVDGGVPTTAALASATSLAAQACGLAGRTGRLRAGLDADLCIVNGDPTTDITAIRDVRTVVFRGRPR